VEDRRAQEIARKRAQAAQLRVQSDEALAKGDAAGCARLGDLAAIAEQAADILEAGEGAPPLQNTKQSRKMVGMTSAQRRERAGAIGMAQAEPGDAFQAAVQASKWKSANRYARERLKVSPAMLSRYRAGDYTVPEHVAKMVAADLGLKLGK
jgi:hypothetical protein